MEDTFNPYAEWLGIAHRGERPNHYALLGLAPFESDAAAITAAAEQRMIALAHVQAGPREPLRRQVLAELTQAKQTLTEVAKKQRYDEALRQRATPRKAAQPVLLPPRASITSGPALPSLAVNADPMAPVAGRGASGDPMAPLGELSPVPVAPPLQVPPGGQLPEVDQPSAEISDQLASARMTARKLAVRRQKAPYWVIAGMLVLLVVVAAGLAVGYATGLIRIGPAPNVAKGDPDVPYLPPPRSADDEDAIRRPVVDGRGMLAGRDSGRRNGKTKRGSGASKPPNGVSGVAEAPRTADKELSSPLPAATDQTSKPAGDATATESESANGDAATKPTDPPVDPAQAARFKVELTAARKALGERKTQAAKDRIEAAKKLAASGEQKQLVAGFQALTKFVDGFWDAVREGLKGLQASGELQVGSTIVSVVEVGPERLIIRANGQNHRYPLDQLPAGIAVAIAKKWFDDRPENKLYLGAFYFVDPRTEIAEAKRLWEEAAGAQVDVKNLLELLPIASDK